MIAKSGPKSTSVYIPPSDPSSSPASGASRPRDADATRLALLKAAQRRFVLLGFERTTTREIAADAGVNIALISRYFGGKQGLFEAVMERHHELMTPPEEQDPDVVGQFIAGLSADAWPELGTHPLVLLLRDDGSDERIRSLRTKSLDRVVDGVRPRPSDAPALSAEEQVRRQLVVALFAGIVALRDVAQLEPLASASPEVLRPALDDVMALLLGPVTGEPASD